MKKNGHKKVFCILFFLAFTRIIGGQENLPNFNNSCFIDWTLGELYLQASFNLAQAGIKLPSGRYMAEELLKEAYPRLLRPYILSLKVDSSSTIEDLLQQGELSFEDLDSLIAEAAKSPPSLSDDLTRINGRISIFTEKISKLLLRHSRAVEPERPLMPVQAADYTGIIIIAERQLPVHGRRSEALLLPCIFPKIWDTEMNLVYERNMLNPGMQGGAQMVRYAALESIFRSTPSGLEGSLAAFAGTNPLRIIAREVYGIFPTDPVIDREDALKILSTENNRRLLTEGKVVFVLSNEVLKNNQ